MLELIVWLIFQLCGITRDVSPDLVAVAEQRAIEIQTNFSHDGMQTAEILAWNNQPTEELAVRRATEQWKNSPSHYAIIINASFTQIGCATSKADDLWYIACTFDAGTPEPAPTPTPAGTQSIPSAKEPSEPPPVMVEPDRTPAPITLLPDTALGANMSDPAAPTTQEAKRALELFAPHSPLQPITITGLTLRGIFARIEAEARDTAHRGLTAEESARWDRAVESGEAVERLRQIRPEPIIEAAWQAGYDQAKAESIPPQPSAPQPRGFINAGLVYDEIVTETEPPQPSAPPCTRQEPHAECVAINHYTEGPWKCHSPQPSAPQALDVEQHGRICHMAGQVLALVELDAAPRSERDALLHRRLREARAEYKRLSNGEEALAPPQPSAPQALDALRQIADFQRTDDPTDDAAQMQYLALDALDRLSRLPSEGT